jgi:hypothetical protein
MASSWTTPWNAAPPPDGPQLAPAIDRVACRAGQVPRAVTADRGYGQAAVESDLHAAGVHTVAIPRQATTSAARKAVEHGRGFRKLVKWRTGREGRISYLKRGYGWDRTRLDGRHGAAIWFGHGVFTHNLTKITGPGQLSCPGPAAGTKTKTHTYCDGSSARPPDAPGSARPSRPTRRGTHSSPPRSTRESRCATSRKPHRTLIRGPRSGTTGPAATWTGTLPTSWPRISQAPPGNQRRPTTAPPGGHNRQADHPRRPAAPRRGSHGLRPQHKREPPLSARHRIDRDDRLSRM